MADAGTSAWRLAAALKVDTELARWRQLGIRPMLWWRDDDARQPAPELDRLIGLAAGRPLALAVVPDVDLSPLATRLQNEPQVTVGQHGVDHVNRRPAGQVKCEYAEAPSVEALVQSLQAGRESMRAAGIEPAFYTPPWNAVHAGLPRALRRAGYPLLSAGANRVLYTDLPYMSAEIDVLAWKDAPRFKGALRIMSALGQALEDRRRTAEFDRPIGLLTHHLDHDEATWRFLAWSMTWFDARFEWTAVDTLQRPRATTMVQGRALQVMRPMAQPLGV